MYLKGFRIHIFIDREEWSMSKDTENREAIHGAYLLLSMINCNWTSCWESLWVIVTLNHWCRSVHHTLVICHQWRGIWWRCQLSQHGPAQRDAWQVSHCPYIIATSNQYPATIGTSVLQFWYYINWYSQYLKMDTSHLTSYCKTFNNYSDLLWPNCP